MQGAPQAARASFAMPLMVSEPFITSTCADAPPMTTATAPSVPNPSAVLNLIFDPPVQVRFCGMEGADFARPKIFSSVSTPSGETRLTTLCKLLATPCCHPAHLVRDFPVARPPRAAREACGQPPA